MVIFAVYNPVSSDVDCYCATREIAEREVATTWAELIEYDPAYQPEVMIIEMEVLDT